MREREWKREAVDRRHAASGNARGLYTTFLPPPLPPPPPPLPPGASGLYELRVRDAEGGDLVQGCRLARWCVTVSSVRWRVSVLFRLETEDMVLFFEIILTDLLQDCTFAFVATGFSRCLPALYMYCLLCCHMC